MVLPVRVFTKICIPPLRHHRECQGQDPGQGGHPPGPAEADLRWQAARGWQDSVRLQHPEGEHSSPCAPSPWRELNCGSKSRNSFECISDVFTPSKFKIVTIG